MQNMMCDVRYVAIQTWFFVIYCLYESREDLNLAYGVFKRLLVVLRNQTQVTVICMQ